MEYGVGYSLGNSNDLAFALVAASNAPLLLLDDRLNIIAASKSFGRTYQLEHAAIAGLPLASIGSGEWSTPQLAVLLRIAVSGIADVQDHEMELVLEDCSIRHLVLNAAKLLYGDETNVCIVMSVQDVTDARASERIKSGLLEDRDLFLTEVHHRVANSLQIVASMLMRKSRTVQSEETRNHLFDARQRVMSIASLQRQLAFSKVDKIELQLYLTTLCDGIAAAMIYDHGRLSLEVVADECVVSADLSMGLGLIVTELIINALKHAFPNSRVGKILVRYCSSGHAWTLSVSDDGVGMPLRFGDVKNELGASVVEALAKKLGATVAAKNANPGTIVFIECKHVPIPAQMPALREKGVLDLPSQLYGTEARRGQ